MKATEEQHEAAYDAYYNAINNWEVIRRGPKYFVSKRLNFSVKEVSDKEVTQWSFDDKETADRFLIVKLLEEIVDAVVSAVK